METARQVRARARAQLVDLIKDTARRHLAEAGPGGLSLRAVARDLDMASSALYRYFANRDDLLTALIVDAYDAVGEAAEAADADAEAAGEPAAARWLAVCRAVRGWACAHPQEFALVYGSPVPGYRAPQATVGPASRIPLVLVRVVRAALEAGQLHPPGPPVTDGALVDPGLPGALSLPADAPPDLLERGITVWVALVGTITFELFGHFENVVADRDGFFEAAMALAAAQLGLDRPGSSAGRPDAAG